MLFAVDSPFLEEGFRLHIITLRLLGAEQKEGEAKTKSGRPKPLGRLPRTTRTEGYRGEGTVRRRRAPH